jgi:hypothetical protein
MRQEEHRMSGSLEPVADCSIPQQGAGALKSGWSGVLAMTLCAFALVASEFMPVSLLTPVATDLNVAKGSPGRRSPSQAHLRS